MKPRRIRLLLVALVMAGAAVAIAELVAARITARSLQRRDYGVSTERRFPNPDRITGPGMDWVRASPGRDRPPWQGQWTHIRPDDIIHLGPDTEAKAITELDRRAVVKLTADQFRAYTGRPQLPSEPVRAFLVQGVEYDELPDSCLDMYLEGGSLIVRCPANETSLRKRPMIVLVKVELDRVYFEFSFPV